MITEELRLYAKKDRGKRLNRNRNYNHNHYNNINPDNNQKIETKADIDDYDHDRWDLPNYLNPVKNEPGYIPEYSGINMIQGNDTTVDKVRRTPLPDELRNDLIEPGSKLPQKPRVPKPHLSYIGNYYIKGLPWLTRLAPGTRLSNYYKKKDYEKAKAEASSPIPAKQVKPGKFRNWVTSHYSIKYDLNTRTFSLIENG